MIINEIEIKLINEIEIESIILGLLTEMSAYS